MRELSAPVTFPQHTSVVAVSVWNLGAEIARLGGSGNGRGVRAVMRSRKCGAIGASSRRGSLLARWTMRNLGEIPRARDGLRLGLTARGAGRMLGAPKSVSTQPRLARGFSFGVWVDRR